MPDTQPTKPPLKLFRRFSSRCYAAWAIILLCALPILLNLLGIEFSSDPTPLSPDKVTNGQIKTDDLFYAVAGAMHHALLEWSAVIIAVIAALASFLHYAMRRDVTVPIIGMALLCAGLVDAFHTLAATRIIEAQAPNTDFIPFTWAISRIFNASIMIIGASISLWILQQSTDKAKFRLHGLSTLLTISVVFVGLAYAVVYAAAISNALPQTMFPDALITRPYDVLPLALFVLGGALFWTCYKHDHSVIKFALILSIIPEVTSQLHMAFGSIALFDNHFNIAHALKIFAYGTILLGLLMDLVEHSPQQSTHQTPINNLTLKTYLNNDGALEVGKASRPLSIQIPIATFTLALFIGLLVSTSLYLEAERFVLKHEQHALNIDSQIVQTELATFRNRSMILDISLAFVALAFAILASRRLTQPLVKMSNAVQNFEHTGQIKQLPIHSPDEMGVLARSFHNLLLRINDSLQQQQHSAKLAQESTARLEAILNSAADAIITIDTQGNILSFNQAAEHIFGYAETAVLGHNVKQLMPSSYAEKHDDFLQNYLHTGHTKIIGQGRDLPGLRKNGDIFQMHLAISEVKTADGRIFTGIIRDITQQKQAESALIKAKEAAEDAARYKSEFLASMSHEIRTPMNGVLGMLGLLQRGQLSKEQSHYATLARSSAESLLTLINDILDFSKVEAGKLALEFLDYNLRAQLKELAETMAHRAQDKGLELILDITQIDQSMVIGDPGRLRQILTNLVSNAIKFTESGEIVIHAALNKITNNALQLHCSVTDTGIGIPKNKQAILFESFTQVDASTTREFGGTGLGLAICKQLCELMDGNIRVNSELSQGSCFDFNVTLQPSPQSKTVSPNIDIHEIPILVVDDNKVNRKMLCRQLVHWGAIVTEAADGSTALTWLNQQLNQPSHQRCMMAFLDEEMPDMDGITLSKAIRANPQLDATKLVLMTSISTLSNAQQMTHLSFDAHFTKPTTPSDIFDALVTIMTGKAKNPITFSHSKESNYMSQTPQTRDTQLAKQTRLLLVEDNRTNQEVALGIMGIMGFSADVAGNGVEAIAALQHSPDDAPYHLILMDCQMPEMDGFEATRQIRRGQGGETYRQLPIIAMTANAMQGDKEKCLNAGMSDYISKPIDPDILEDKLYHWLSSNTEKGAIESNESTTATTDNAHQPLMTWDKSAALKRIRNKETILKKLVQMFIDDMPERMTNLQQTIEHDAFTDTKSLAHTIKGVASNLSGLQLADTAAKLEALSTAADAAQIKSLWPVLAKQYKALEESLQTFLSETNSASTPTQENNGWVDSLPGLNIKLGLRLVLYQKDMYQGIAGRFVTRYAENITPLRELLIKNAKQEAIMWVHSLKGLAGTLGATELQAIAQQTELSLEETGTSEALKLEPMLNNLQAEMNKAISALEKITLLKAS